jgi:predicted enzyme related to lactoylglutathione lyase
MHGQFVWYELTTPDVDASRRFYPPITGWGTQQFDKDYTMWTTSGAPFAGIFRLGPEQRARGIPPNWMPYVEADNVDESARKAALLGGKVVHGPEEIPGTGRFAVVQDPQGAVFGIYKSHKPSRAWDGTQAVGRFSWHELMTTDYAKAFDFYRQLFGWKKTGEMDMGGGNMYFMYGQEKPFGGIFNRMPDMASVPPFWLCYVHVKDVKKAVEVATRAGAILQRGPMEVPGGSIAILSDPQGAAFAVHEGAQASVTEPKAAARKTPKAASRPKAKAPKAKATTKAKARKRPAAKKTSRKAKTKPKRRKR